MQSQPSTNDDDNLHDEGMGPEQEPTEAEEKEYAAIRKESEQDA